MNRIKLFSVGPDEEEKIAGVTVPMYASKHLNICLYQKSFK